MKYVEKEVFYIFFAKAPLIIDLYVIIFLQKGGFK